MTVLIMTRRILGIPVALLLALLVQVVLVNRLPLPGGAAPDLVLLVVAAAGVTTGPAIGMLAGFGGGLALDIAPPSGHLAGEYALVFCLAGYACGRLRAVTALMEEHTSVASLTVVALGAAGGEAAKAALGMMLSDPDMTGPVIKHVLPGAILYDLLLSPLVLWLIAAAVRDRAPERIVDPHRRQPRTAPQFGAFRLATAGAAPRLKLGGATFAPSRPPQRKEPKLRLSGTSSPLSSRTVPGSSPSALSPSARRPVSVNFSGASRGGLIGGRALGPSLFPGSGSQRPGFARSGPGKGWLRADKPAGGAAPSRKAPGKHWLRSTGTPGLSRFSGSALNTRPAVPNFRRQRPSKGWLRVGTPAAASRRGSPGKGWLKQGKPASSSWQRKSPGKGWLRGSRRKKSGNRRKKMGGLR